MGIGVRVDRRERNSRANWEGADVVLGLQEVSRGKIKRTGSQSNGLHHDL